MSTTKKLNLKELIAMGVGGMVGGGIFSVLGLSIDLAGHAAYIAFAIGGIIALLTGISYSKLGLQFRSDGGSFTYLEHAFKNKNVAGIGGWLLIVGYIGTLSLYAFTFSAYGAALSSQAEYVGAIRHLLSSLIILIFLGINLYGIKAAGETEELIVMVKVFLLLLFGVIGLYSLQTEKILPVFDKSVNGVLVGAALIFVAYEGFELIPNAIHEMENPGKNLRKAIIYSILITLVIYILVSLVAIGNLTPAEIHKYKEYALAVAANPFLGHLGFVLISLAAILSTSSAINATMFGTARLAMVMSQEKDLPKVFSYKERTKDIPYISLIIISAVTIIFVNIADLTIISSFASSTFLLIFASINIAALRLKDVIKINLAVPLTGFILSIISWVILYVYLWQTNRRQLIWVIIFYLTIIVVELLFSERKLIKGSKKKM
ncbi:inner membrane transport protein YbaT [bacterium BMS3Abin03]|nr:inner membrane transport protein YbaT [bacterium BMS3Abin03]